jgi:CBS domain containing-hemolysin-like protein
MLEAGKESPSEELADGTVSVAGLMPIHDMNERFGLNLPGGRVGTVGGLVLTALGRMPVPGDEVTFDGVRLLIERVNGNRVDRVRLLTGAKR